MIDVSVGRRYVAVAELVFDHVEWYVLVREIERMRVSQTVSVNPMVDFSSCCNSFQHVPDV